MKIKKMIQETLNGKNRIVIGIDGQCGSGKSTLAKELAKEYQALLIHMDDYFLPPEMKTKERLSEAGGNVHYERIKQEVFEHITEDKIFIRKFNCNSNILEDPVEFENKDIIIVEGSYSLHKELRDFYDIKVFLKVSYDLQIERIKNRSGERLLKRFVDEWIPLENKYFHDEKIEDIADVVIENS